MPSISMPPVVIRTLVLLTAVLASGCSSTASKKPRYKPVREQLTEAEAQQLKEVHDLWKTEDPRFVAARDKVLQNPTTAAWWARNLIFYAVGSHKKQLRRQRQLLGTIEVREATGYKKALAELRIVGSPAVPIVVKELLRHPYKENSDVGVAILTHMGPAILPDLEPYLQHPDKRVPRQVLEVLGSMAHDPRAQKLLVRYAGHPDYAMRAQALRGLANAGTAYLPTLRRVAATDPDPFVRRQVVAALARFKDKQTAILVVAYYKDVLRKNDRQGMVTAQRTLQAMSGIRGEHTEGYWQRWVQGLPDQPENENRNENSNKNPNQGR